MPPRSVSRAHSYAQLRLVALSETLLKVKVDVLKPKLIALVDSMNTMMLSCICADLLWYKAQGRLERIEEGLDEGDFLAAAKAPTPAGETTSPTKGGPAVTGGKSPRERELETENNRLRLKLQHPPGGRGGGSCLT